jgi:hypothetical protein
MTRTALAWGLLLFLQGCGGDDEPPPPPPDPPTLRIDGFVNGDGAPFDADADCVELGSDPDRTLLVQLEGTSATSIGDWLLRPPGTCGSAAECGHLQVRVDPQDVNVYGLQTTGSTTTVALPFGRPCPQTSSASECVGIDDPTGEHTIEVTLRDDDGIAVREDDGAPVSASVDVTLGDPGTCEP